MTVPQGVQETLHSLSARYAAGVDRRDQELFLNVFDHDATLIVYPDDSASSEPTRILRGHDEISHVTSRIARNSRTFHQVGQGLYDIGDGVATGEVYCVAYHLRADAAPTTNRVMYIRYRDSYRRDAGGEWKIAAREVRPDWTESRVVTIDE